MYFEWSWLCPLVYHVLGLDQGAQVLA